MARSKSDQAFDERIAKNSEELRELLTLAQLLHGNADAGLGEAQLIDHIDGAHTAHPLGEHKDRFKIIFCGLVDLHGMFASCLCRDAKHHGFI